MLDLLSGLDVGELVKRLCAAYGKPYGSKTEALVEIWSDKLRHYPGRVVREVIEHWIETQPRFPAISAVLALVRERVPRTDLERNRPVPLEYSCPDCHTVPAERRWYVVRKSRADRRPAAIVVKVQDVDVELVIAWRVLCDCEWDRVVRTRNELERRALEEEPIAAVPRPTPSSASAGPEALSTVVDRQLDARKAAWKAGLAGTAA